MRTPTSRGFTLIELMVVVCIIGLLASIALPVYRRATLRTRVAERATILQSLGMAIQDAFNRGVIPSGTTVVGAENPAPPTTMSRRPFVQSLAGWRDLSLIVQGGCYYTYSFEATESASGASAVYSMKAEGDLDGDGVPSIKQFAYSRIDGHWTLLREDPAPGDEDTTTF